MHVCDHYPRAGKIVVVKVIVIPDFIIISFLRKFSQIALASLPFYIDKL